MAQTTHQYQSCIEDPKIVARVIQRALNGTIQLKMKDLLAIAPDANVYSPNEAPTSRPPQLMFAQHVAGQHQHLQAVTSTTAMNWQSRHSNSSTKKSHHPSRSSRSSMPPISMSPAVWLSLSNIALTNLEENGYTRYVHVYASGACSNHAQPRLTSTDMDNSPPSTPIEFLFRSIFPHPHLSSTTLRAPHPSERRTDSSTRPAANDESFETMVKRDFPQHGAASLEASHSDLSIDVEHPHSPLPYVDNRSLRLTVATPSTAIIRTAREPPIELLIALRPRTR
ncbi:hypothetical protein PLEOSDRAFT_1114044 [Pleurotus ostreatus PC15]|uniref:Uncharacterized protein n=1 Tax=Pleurotus ostreatus (strain PC15) TaxID=1137138 RepID=A0A067NAL1_PLEO1|nr:hypothetical protein PLEOSDRAFT_1114044 [Pleurotus ostreatus PC15]